MVSSTLCPAVHILGSQNVYGRAEGIADHYWPWTIFYGISTHYHRGPRKTNLIKQILSETFWGRLDVLLFDTPPGTSDEHLTIVKLLRGIAKLEGAIVVTTTQEVALGVVRREMTFCKQMNLDVVGIVQNMAGFLCPCCDQITGGRITTPYTH